MRGVDEFLADADAAIEDWESGDAATWAADGSHEHFTPLMLVPQSQLWFAPAGTSLPRLVDFAPIVGFTAAAASVASEVTIAFDASGFIRAVQRAIREMVRFELSLMGVPVPPPRRTESRMTARRYRAARRAYRRELDLHRRESGCRGNHRLEGLL